MVMLLEKMERGEVINPTVSKEMLDLMKREQGTNGFGAKSGVCQGDQVGRARRTAQ